MIFFSFFIEIAAGYISGHCFLFDHFVYIFKRTFQFSFTMSFFCWREIMTKCIMLSSSKIIVWIIEISIHNRAALVTTRAPSAPVKPLRTKGNWRTHSCISTIFYSCLKLLGTTSGRTVTQQMSGIFEHRDVYKYTYIVPGYSKGQIDCDPCNNPVCLRGHASLNGFVLILIGTGQLRR